MAINNVLIQGQRLMREAGKDKRGEALVKGFTETLAAGVAERKMIDAKADKYMEDLGGIENVNLIEPSQRQAVTDFLRTKRDEFSDLAGQYAENPSSEIKDKMDAIKFQFSTVNNQLKSYMDKRKEFLSDRDSGNLMKDGSFAKNNGFFTNTYGNPDAQFNIDYDTGKISFTASNGEEDETRSLDDFGDYAMKNYEGLASSSQAFTDAKKAKFNGTLFDKQGTTQAWIFKHREQSPDEVQSLIQSDLSGDNSDLSFMKQWESGNLKDKSLYNGFEANEDGTYDASWMLEDANKNETLEMMGKFVGNVSEDIYNTSDSKQKKKGGGGGDDSKNPFKKAFPIKDQNGKTISYIQPNERQIVRDSVFSDPPGNFTGHYGDYEYNSDTGKYNLVVGGEVVKEGIDKLDVLNREGGRMPGDKSAIKDTENRVGLSTGQISVNEAFIGGDDSTSNAINEFFGLSKTKDVMFVPFSRITGKGAFGYSDNADAIATNDIMLLDNRTKEPIKDENGDVIRIKSGNSTGDIDYDAERDKVNKIMEKYGYIDNFTGDTDTSGQTDPLG